MVYAGGLLLGLVAFTAWVPDVFRYFPCFLPGVVAFGMASQGARRLLPSWVLSLVLMATFARYEKLGRWSQTVGAYPACLAVGLAIPFLRESRLERLNAACGTVSKYSYGVYLIHAPALALSFAAAVPLPVKIALFALSTATLSMLAYRFVEQPLIDVGKVLTRPRQRPSTV